jgi:hypothetical protein
MRNWKPGFVCGVVVAGFLLLTSAVVAGQSAATTTEKPVLTDEVFKSVVLLRGIPVDTFFEAMGMFANAMGNDCTFCHSAKAYYDKALFAEPTPRIMRARQMITMTNAINKQYFGGAPRVTCFTCHNGSWVPKSEPDIALQYGIPVEDPNAKDFPTDSRFMAADVFAKYIQAIGGAARVGALTSFSAKGSYEGFDTGFDKVPVEIVAKAPAQQTMVVQMAAGPSTRIFDGASAWMSGPDTPLPILTLTGGNLDRARLEALAAFPLGLAKAFPEWRVGRTAIDEHEVMVVQGLQTGQPQANFYFDTDGLLVRIVRWTATPVGLVPTQIDYSDYRDVANVKMPFKRVVSQTYMQMTVLLDDVQPNVAIAAERFQRPAAATRTDYRR